MCSHEAAAFGRCQSCILCQGSLISYTKIFLTSFFRFFLRYSLLLRHGRQCFSISVSIPAVLISICMPSPQPCVLVVLSVCTHSINHHAERSMDQSWLTMLNDPWFRADYGRAMRYQSLDATPDYFSSISTQLR